MSIQLDFAQFNDNLFLCSHDLFLLIPYFPEINEMAYKLKYVHQQIMLFKTEIGMHKRNQIKGDQEKKP